MERDIDKDSGFRQPQSLKRDLTPQQTFTEEEIIDMIGDPKQLALELAEFRKEAQSYDPSPDKRLILQSSCANLNSALTQDRAEL